MTGSLEARALKKVRALIVSPVALALLLYPAYAICGSVGMKLYIWTLLTSVALKSGTSVEGEIPSCSRIEAVASGM